MKRARAEIAADAVNEARLGQRAWVERTVKVLFGAAVVAFGVVFVASQWHDLGPALSQAQPGWIAVAAMATVLGQWAAALAFRCVLAATSRWLPVPDVALVFFVSQLGKYIPGSIWPLVAVAQMCRRYGVARRIATVSAVLALVYSILTGGLLGIVLVLVGASGLAWLALLIPVAVAALHPRVLIPSLNLVLRVARREEVEVDLSGTALAGSLAWPVVSWLLLGLQCWALVVSLGGPALGSLAPSIGGFALAYVAGALFVPAPAGVGVRETVLGVALMSIISNSQTFGRNEVIVVVLLSRVLLAVLDFAQAGAAVLFGRLRRASPVP